MKKSNRCGFRRISQNLARGESVRVNFLEQLNIFFDLLSQSILTGDPAWLNSVLDAWTESRTENDLEEQKASITKILDTILLTTVEIAQEILDKYRWFTTYQFFTTNICLRVKLHYRN